MVNGSDQAARHRRLRAEHLTRAAQEGRAYVCARCGVAGDDTTPLEVYPRVGGGVTLSRVMRQVDYGLVRKVLENRALLCRQCVVYEDTGRAELDAIIASTRPATPYVVKGGA